MNSGDDKPVLLVGAGAAGISAALWLQDFDVAFDWIAIDPKPGGILRKVHNSIENYPGGFFADGPALADSMANHLQSIELQPRQARLTNVVTDKSTLRCVIDDATEHRPTFLLLATGTEYRRLGVPGEKQGLHKWISQSATADAPRFAGRHVAVVGGGDSGLENALILSQHDCRITLLLRSPELKARPAFIDAIDDDPAISIAPMPSVVKRIERSDEGCRLHVDQQGQPVTYDVAALFVRIGVDPIIPSGCEELERDDRGFLVVDPDGRSSRPEIYAVGDVIATPLRSVATAVGGGARAARAIAVELGKF